MKIQEFGTLLMTRTNQNHFGSSVVVQNNIIHTLEDTLSPVQKITRGTEAASVQRAGGAQKADFGDYLFKALNSVNGQQNDVSALTQKLMTDPDDVDVHDVTIAISKARQSLNLAQSVIDRLVSGWNEISTTR